MSGNLFRRVLFASMNAPLRVSSSGYLDENLCNISDNTVFQRYINIDLRDEIVEVPVFCRRKVQPLLENNLREIDGKCIEYFVRPLYITRSVQKRTSDSIIRTMFEHSTEDNLIKVTTNSGTVYYGGVGIIFDSNMECIFLSTVTYIKPKSDGTKYSLAKSTIHISPKVFTSTDLLEKAIIKRILPIIITEKVGLDSFSRNVINTFNRGSGAYETAIPDIMVHDINEQFISRPSMPDISTFTNEYINSWLLEHADNIASNIIL